MPRRSLPCSQRPGRPLDRSPAGPLARLPDRSRADSVARLAACPRAGTAARLAAFVLLAAPAPAGVLLVDPVGGPGLHTSIQSAVDAAQDGDVVLVKSGTYPGFLVNAKSVQVVGDAGASVTLTSGVRVRSLPAGGLVLLANLAGTALPDTGNFVHGLGCYDNQGTLRVEGCSFTGATSVSPLLARHDGGDGARVELSPRVSFRDCTLTGGGGYAGWDPDMGTSGAGLYVDGSSVAVHQSQLHGGDGQDNVYGQPDAAHGGDGGRALNSTLFLAASTLQGGSGGDGTSVYFVLYALGGNGGDGLELSGSTTRLLGSGTTQGAGGTGWPPGGGAGGSPGLARRGAAAQFIDLVGSARQAVIPTPVRESTNPQLEFFGQPGEHVFLLLSRDPAFQFRPVWNGMLFVQPSVPRPMLLLGELDLGGSLVTRVPLGNFAPALGSTTLFLQPLFENGLGQRALGPGSTMVVLDAAF